MKAIRIDNLKKTYKSGFINKKKTFALRGISFEIEEGEIFGFLGPNGSGKTTTILSMLNLIKKDSGKVLFFEKELEKDYKLFKDIGYVPEEPYLYNNLKVFEFLYLSSRLSEMEENNLKEKIDFYLGLFELSQKKEVYIKNLSKGQKQRVLLSLNFLIEPKVLILDEPFRGLDPLGIKNVREEIKKLKEKRKTVFLSSHIISEVEQLCTEVAIIKDGLLIWEGNPKEIPKSFGAFKIFYKFKEEKFEKNVKNQEELVNLLNEINLKGGEIVEILKEKSLEDYFIEKIGEKNGKN